MPTNIVRNPRIDVVVSEGMGSSDSLATVEGHKMSPPKSTYPSKASSDGGGTRLRDCTFYDILNFVNAIPCYLHILSNIKWATIRCFLL